MKNFLLCSRSLRELKQSKTGMETLSEEEKWCIYLKYRHEKNAEPLIEELCRKEEGIMRAEKAVEKISRSYLKYIREMNIAKNEYDRWLFAEISRDEALYGVARKMKTAGKPMNEIEEFTGLSSQTIENL